MITVKHGFATARNVYSLMHAIVFFEMLCVLSVKEESGIMAVGVSLAVFASSLFVRIASLSTRPAARWLKQKT